MESNMQNQKPLILYNASIKNIGISNVIISGKEIIINCNSINYHFKELISNIDFLVYSRGNLFLEDKFYIGINSHIFEITCKNEYTLKDFYYSIVQLKEGNPNNNKDTRTNNALPETPDKRYDKIREYYQQMNNRIISKKEFEEKKSVILEEINKTSKENDNNEL